MFIAYPPRLIIGSVRSRTWLGNELVGWASKQPISLNVFAETYNGGSGDRGAFCSWRHPNFESGARKTTSLPTTVANSN